MLNTCKSDFNCIPHYENGDTEITKAKARVSLIPNFFFTLIGQNKWATAFFLRKNGLKKTGEASSNSGSCVELISL